MTRLNEQQIEIMKDELAVELADWLMETYGWLYSGRGIGHSLYFRNIRPPSKFGNRFLLPKCGLCSLLFTE